MKKWMTAVCVLAVCVALTACRGGNDAQKDSVQGESMVQNTQPESGDTADTGQTQQAVWSDEMNEIRAAVSDKLGEGYLPAMPMDAEALEELMGVAPQQYDAYMGELSAVSQHVDMMVVVRTKEGQLELIEDAMNACRESLISTTAASPEEQGKLQASRIERIGQYVCFVQLGGDLSAVAEQGEEEVIKYCLDQNEIAIDAIRSVVVK